MDDDPKEYTPPVDNIAELEKIRYQLLKTNDPEETAILAAKSQAILREWKSSVGTSEPTEAQKVASNMLGAVIGGTWVPLMLSLVLLMLYCVI
jgi:hypothetical protein